ncbi:MAG: hypothetical protein ACYTEX_28130 [Planctomycetota bacterium]|jgi:hypothetical protein
MNMVCSGSNTSYAKFDYEYDSNSNNISKMTYDHRDPNDPCTEFTYDRLDRLTIAEYGILDNLTNRYDEDCSDASVFEESASSSFLSMRALNASHESGGSMAP